MYLTISGITHAAPTDCNVDVWVETHTLEGTRMFVVRVTPRAVTVYAVDGNDVDNGTVDWNGDIDVSRVQVAPDLIDATRRLFGLVGVA